MEQTCSTLFRVRIGVCVASGIQGGLGTIFEHFFLFVVVIPSWVILYPPSAAPRLCNL